MKLKFFALALAFALAAVLSFATPEAEDTSGSQMATTGPQYGGTLTMLHQRSSGDPPSPAQKDSQVQAIEGWLAAIQEHGMLGDYRKFGGMGTGEFMFEFSDYIPWKYTKGQLFESWEITPTYAKIFVRKGVYWAPNKEQQAWMPARELTADDIAFDINTFWHASWGTRFNGTLAKDTYALDKYTVMCEFENYNSQFIYYIGDEDRAVYSPPELENNNPQLWKNQVGTGPWMFESYTIGSNMKLTRNPNYWDSIVVDGREYQMPFIDTFVMPIIPDDATKMSAVRTGKVDIIFQPAVGQWDNYESVGPNLKSYTFSPGNGQSVGFNTKKPPFDNVKVRQAMAIGTDRMQFAKLLRSDSKPIRFHPQPPTNPDFFVKDSELPADVAALYKYDVAKAKQMLAEAGYPNGFKTELLCRSVALDQDVASIVKEQWAKIGVNAEIVVMEPSAHAQKMYAVEYNGALVPSGLDAANPVIVLTSEGKTGAYYNFTGMSNPEFDAIVTKIEREIDEAKQIPLIKQASIVMMREAAYLPLAQSVSKIYWWKYLKNYYGEYSLSDGTPHEMTPYWWIDQAEKKALGF
ncbi:MAG: ABC transporter substrate-binding protein [Spirochaetales bacterium]|nr:ABC transporter substrate-binding protein [Spirochaetales bacterium]